MNETENVSHTVILKWNPAISSMSFYDHLYRIVGAIGNADWSIWDHKKVKSGDRFHMLKVGLGTCGIVTAGIITSNPETDEDWSGKGRKVYYCNYHAEFIINPETLPIIGTAQLQAAIPDFDWTGGHSGVVLGEDQARVLQEMYVSYLRENAPVFRERLEFLLEHTQLNDQLFLDESMRRRLFERK